MDIFRTALCVGLAIVLWNARVRGVRPVRDFVLWGLLYPFHFMLMTLLILVIWGLAGVEYGVQSLFLEDNPLTQFFAGSAVMLLFATLILHYSVLDPPNRWRNHSLKTLVSVLRDMNGLMPPEFPINRFIRNGFLEKLDRNEIEAIHQSILIEEGGGASEAALGPEGSRRWAELEAMLKDEPFRLLVSPAILVVKGLMLGFLVGVVPTILFPLLRLDPSGFLERLPWLAGVIVGDLLGLVLACWTTRWAADAAGWRDFEAHLIPAIRAWAEFVERSASSPEQSGVVTEPLGRAAGPLPAKLPRVGSGVLSFLTAFFVIHFIAKRRAAGQRDEPLDRLARADLHRDPRRRRRCAGVPSIAGRASRGFRWSFFWRSAAAALVLRGLKLLPDARVRSALARVHAGSKTVAGFALATLSHRTVG